MSMDTGSFNAIACVFTSRRGRLILWDILSRKYLLVVVPLSLHLFCVGCDHEAHLTRRFQKKLCSAIVIHTCINTARFKYVKAEAELFDLVEDHAAHRLLETDLKLALVKVGAPGEDYDRDNFASKDVVCEENRQN